uniref:Large ribosomal subunit protein mL46 n=1 Tax=Sphenodon punctatus TaxID=8508 RepID=A0A8D0H4I2_SPHPU
MFTPVNHGGRGESDLPRFRPSSSEERKQADEKDDRTSLNRKLDRSLLLLVKEKIGDQEIWLLPQAEWRTGETLRGTAERALFALSGNCLQVTFLGNAPCGLYKYQYPRAIRTEDWVGDKLFFFKAILQSGDLLQAEKRADHVWVSKGELGDYLKPRYLAQVSRFFMDL